MPSVNEGIAAVVLVAVVYCLWPLTGLIPRPRRRGDHRRH